MAANLINFKQIKDGALVADAVKNWLKSGFPADQVSTEIVKTPAYVPTDAEKAAGAVAKDAEYYTVEEMLESLKKLTDTALGNGSKSVMQMIEDAKKEVQGDLDKLKAQKVRDYVKMTGIIDHDGTVTLNDPIDRDSAAYQKEAMLGLHDGETLGVQDLDANKAYNLYYEDNTPVRDKKGNNVTLTFKKLGNNVDGIGTGLTEVRLAQEKNLDASFDKYGSIVSDSPYVRDTKVTPHKVVNVVQQLKGTREIQLSHQNVARGSLKVLHTHDYYEPTEHDGPVLVTKAHDANLDHLDVKTLGVAVVEKNKKLNLPKSAYFFNGAAGRILFKQDMTDTFTISYEYETTDVVFAKDTRDGVKIKLFPIGTYSLNKLDQNFLLDNNEVNLIAYSKAIDEIVAKLAEGGAFSEYIASLLSTQEVQNAVIARTEEMTRQAQMDKLELYNHDAELENAMRDLAYEVDQLNALHQNANKIDNLEVTVSKKDDKAGQIDFTLRQIPDKHPVVLWINGVRYFEKKHFVVNRTRTIQVGAAGTGAAAPQLSWTFTESNGGFNLYKEDEFDIEAQYNVRTEIAPVIPAPYYTLQTMEDRTAERAAKAQEWKEAVALAQKNGTTPPAKFQYMNQRPYNKDLIDANGADRTILV